MSRIDELSGPPGAQVTPSETLAAPDPASALRRAVALWAEQNTRPETLARVPLQRLI